MPCIVASVNPIRSTAHLLGIETGLSGVGYQEVRGVTVSLAGERGPPPIPWLDGLIHRCSVSLSNKSLSLSLSLLDLDGGDSGGDRKVSITHDGHEAILNEVVGPGLIAVNTCVDMMCVSTMRATTGALPIVGDESQHGRQRYPQE